MKFWATTAFALLIGLFAFSPASAQSGEGWVQLFDGKTVPALDSVGPSANWRVENGELVADKLAADKGTNHLLTKEKYKDFQIHLEFWSDEKVNSGLFIRCQDPEEHRRQELLRGQHLRRPARSELRHRRDRVFRRGQSDAEGRRQVEHHGGHRQGPAHHRDPQRPADRATLHNGLFEEGPFTLQYGSGVLKVRKFAVKKL